MADEVGERFPKSTYNEKYDQDVCPICQEDFKVGDEILTLPCLHIFHTEGSGECPGVLKSWVHRRGTCPMCRTCVHQPLFPRFEPWNVISEDFDFDGDFEMPALIEIPPLVSRSASAIADEVLNFDLLSYGVQHIMPDLIPIPSIMYEVSDDDDMDLPALVARSSSASSAYSQTLRAVRDIISLASPSVAGSDITHEDDDNPEGWISYVLEEEFREEDDSTISAYNPSISLLTEENLNAFEGFTDYSYDDEFDDRSVSNGWVPFYESYTESPAGGSLVDAYFGDTSELVVLRDLEERDSPILGAELIEAQVEDSGSYVNEALSVTEYDSYSNDEIEVPFTDEETESVPFSCESRSREYEQVMFFEDPMWLRRQAQIDSLR